jgi:hypothetical protein
MTKQTKAFCWTFWLLRYGICQISRTYTAKTATAFKNERNDPHCSNVTLLSYKRKTFSSKYPSRFGAVSHRPSQKAAWRYYVLYQESGYVVRRIQYGYWILVSYRTPFVQITVFAKMLQEHLVTVRHDLTHFKSRQAAKFLGRVLTLTRTILRGRENLE